MSYTEDSEKDAFMPRKNNKSRSPTRPKKIDKVLEKVRASVIKGSYRDTRHSTDQGVAREIDLQDIIEVLGKNGFHEKKKDEFREDFQSWNYAIRGKTFEGKDLRIAVYFGGKLVMIATVIDVSPN